jgi:hypothetical protein
MSGILLDDGVSTSTANKSNKRLKVMAVGVVLIVIGIIFFAVGQLSSPPPDGAGQAYATTLNISVITPEDAHGQRILEIQHTGGEVIESIAELRVTLAPPDGEQMFPSTHLDLG